LRKAVYNYVELYNIDRVRDFGRKKERGTAEEEMEGPTPL